MYLDRTLLSGTRLIFITALCPFSYLALSQFFHQLETYSNHSADECWRKYKWTE